VRKTEVPRQVNYLRTKKFGSGLMLSDSFIVPLHEQLRRQMEHPF
jgi:hypothetical protein